VGLPGTHAKETHEQGCHEEGTEDGYEPVDRLQVERPESEKLSFMRLLKTEYLRYGCHTAESMNQPNSRRGG
jgi:hypothetical protein